MPETITAAAEQQTAAPITRPGDPSPYQWAEEGGPFPARLAGAALLAHHAERWSSAALNTRKNRAGIMAAGFVTYAARSGQTVATWTEYSEAVASARLSEHGSGPISSRPTPYVLAGFAVDGQPVGPWLPIEAEATISGATYGEEALGQAMQWANDHAAELLADLYDNGAQGPAALMIADAEGIEPLASVHRRTWIGPSGTAHSWQIEPLDTLPRGVEQCTHCGALTTDGEASTVDGETACSSCADDAESCDCCGESFSSGTLTRTESGDHVCSGCLDDEYFYCPVLDGYVDSDETVPIYGGGVWWRGANRTTLSREGAEHLEESGELWRDDDGDFTGEAPEEENDADDDDEHQGDTIGGGCRIYPYHTNPNHVHRSSLPGTVYRHGGELEYKGSHPDGATLEEAMGSAAILTRDGTVTGEIVTTCQTIGQLRKTLPRIAAALSTTCNDTATGMHLHTDRAALTPWQWFRLTRYTAAHADTLAKVAGRDSSQWGSFRNTVAQDWPEFARVWKNSCGPRYVGWNVTPRTVELRVCRASKTPARILARLAMLQRLIALGRLPDSAKPSGEELTGWLAQDRHIQQETGWEPGPYNYRDALKVVAQGPDLPPWERLTEAETRAAKVAALMVEASSMAQDAVRQQRYRAEDAWRNARYNGNPETPAYRAAAAILHDWQAIEDTNRDRYRQAAAVAEPIT